MVHDGWFCVSRHMQHVVRAEHEVACDRLWCTPELKLYGFFSVTAGSHI